MTLQGAPGDTGPTGQQGGLVSANGFILDSRQRHVFYFNTSIVGRQNCRTKQLALLKLYLRSKLFLQPIKT